MRKVLGALLCLVSVNVFAQDAGTAAPRKAAATADAGAAAGAGPAVGQTVTVQLKDVKGKAVGEATLRQAAQGLIINLKTKGLPAGEHAFHVHEVGKCEPPFKTAGGHFNPTGHQHGIANVKGKHAGDLPNLHVPKGGEVAVTVFADGLSLSGGTGNVFDADGSSLVIHATGDDYHSDPAGNAGDRIACGVITQKK